MLSRYQHLVDKVRPVSISRDDTAIGSRIGGTAPEGIVPSKVYRSTRYFATVGIDELHTKEVSIFTSLDYHEGGQRSLYQNSSRGFSSEDFVQMVVHRKSRRSRFPSLASELPGHALEVQTEVPDIIVQPGGELILPNKIGGRP